MVSVGVGKGVIVGVGIAVAAGGAVTGSRFTSLLAAGILDGGTGVAVAFAVRSRPQPASSTVKLMASATKRVWRNTLRFSLRFGIIQQIIHIG